MLSELKSDNLNQADETMLEVLLRDREKRYETKAELSRAFARPVISVQLNVPYPQRQERRFLPLIDEGMRHIRDDLVSSGIAVLHSERLADEDSVAEIIVPDSDAERAKRICIAAEESMVHGRLIDADVILPSGRPVKRGDMGLPSRRCLVCSAHARDCLISQKHEKSEVVKAALTIAELPLYGLSGHHGIASITSEIGKAAKRALVSELTLTPKPGLVDTANNGSHNDMCFSTFIKSALVLEPFFSDMASIGKHSGELGMSESDTVFLATQIGIEAEEAMYSATDGVNTHKGAIYSLGLLCTAMGYCLGRKIPITSDNIFSIVSAMAKYKAYEHVKHANSSHSHGEIVRKLYDVPGAKGEAASGFLTLRLYAMPEMYATYRATGNWNKSLLNTLLVLMSKTKDTNVLFRGAENALNYMNETAAAFLNDGGMSAPDAVERLYKMDNDFQAMRISPGGCADLLSVAIFVNYVFGIPGVSRES